MTGAHSSPGLDAIAWPVTTERLSLRRPAVAASADASSDVTAAAAASADTEAVWAYRRLPEVGEWLGWHPADHADFVAGWEERLGQAVLVERGGEVIGDLMIRPSDAWGQREVAQQERGTEAELGWSFAPWAHGHGYATEAVRALIGVCFGPLGLCRVVAGAFLENEPSWRLMECVGLRRESVSRKDSLHRTRGWSDGVQYALLAEEYRQGSEA